MQKFILRCVASIHDFPIDSIRREARERHERLFLLSSLREKPIAAGRDGAEDVGVWVSFGVVGELTPLLEDGVGECFLQDVRVEEAFVGLEFGGPFIFGIHEIRVVIGCPFRNKGCVEGVLGEVYGF